MNSGDLNSLHICWREPLEHRMARLWRICWRLKKVWIVEDDKWRASWRRARCWSVTPLFLVLAATRLPVWVDANFEPIELWFLAPSYVIDDPLKDSPFTLSEFFPEKAVNRHPRFLTLARNIRQRRNRKVEINVPIFRDENTPSPFQNTVKTEESKQAAKDDHIYMDAMGFGMGNSCLQVRFPVRKFWYNTFESFLKIGKKSPSKHLQ